jgi:hypothetical protein
VGEGGSEYGRKRCGERLGPRRIVLGGHMLEIGVSVVLDRREEKT